MRQRADKYNDSSTQVGNEGPHHSTHPRLGAGASRMEAAMPKERRQAWFGVSERRGQCRGARQYRHAATDSDHVDGGITNPELDEQATEARLRRRAHRGGQQTRARAAAFLRVVVHQPEGSTGSRNCQPKSQERLGHASIAMTLDVYGHLFPRGDDAAGVGGGEKLLLGVRTARAPRDPRRRGCLRPAYILSAEGRCLAAAGQP